MHDIRSNPDGARSFLGRMSFDSLAFLQQIPFHNTSFRTNSDAELKEQVYVVMNALSILMRLCTWQFLKRILQTRSSSVKKYTGTGIDTKCSHNGRRCRIRFLDLSGRQSNSVEPERFVTDF